MQEIALILGSEGQIGSELLPVLQARLGASNVVASDIRSPAGPQELFRRIDVTNEASLRRVVREFRVTTIYHLASILSAAGETDPELAWHVNIEGLRNVIAVSRTEKVRQVFWPSSIAVFGPHTPRTRTCQFTVTDPGTIYGISKVTGELLCNYAVTKLGLDIRSLRYPGIISWKTLPGGGTTDYAVAMFYGAANQGRYTCYVRPETALPMMYMPDAVRGTIELMKAPRKNLRSAAYNIAAMSFTARHLEREIRRHIPSFVCAYQPDYRQKIADSWPMSIDDTWARKDWGWKPNFTFSGMVNDMLRNISQDHRTIQCRKVAIA